MRHNILYFGEIKNTNIRLNKLINQDFFICKGLNRWFNILL